MRNSELINRFDIWLVYLHFANNPKVGKVRPVLVVDVTGSRIAAAKITSQPPRDDSVGEFTIKKWSETGLNVPSTVRCSQVFELDFEALLRDHPIGRLHSDDIPGVTAALKDAGFYIDSRPEDTKGFEALS